MNKNKNMVTVDELSKSTTLKKDQILKLLETKDFSKVACTEDRITKDICTVNKIDFIDVIKSEKFCKLYNFHKQQQYLSI